MSDPSLVADLLQVMVLFVLGFIALSVWAVAVDVLLPQILHGSRGSSVLCFVVAVVFLTSVSPPSPHTHTCSSNPVTLGSG